jgi:PPP family 3-phenylpropionic acid transporter
VASPFWPRLFETWAMSPHQIGLLLAVSTAMGLAAGPLVGRLADLLGARRLMLALCAVIAGGSAAAFLLAGGFWLFLAIVLVQAVALAPTAALADALAGRRADYGRIRAAGSAAFVLGTLLIGQMVSASDLRPVIWMHAGLLVLAGLAAGLLPRTRPQAMETPAQEPSVPLKSPIMGALRILLRLRQFRVLLLIAALVFGSHALNDGFAVIRWHAAGIAPSVASLLWAEAVAAEVVVFVALGPVLIARLGLRGAAVLAAGAGIVRWSAMGLTTSVAALAALQPLHGLTFALLHLACMRVIAAVVPMSLSATAQSIYAFASGLASAGLTALCGPLYAGWGGASFFAMALLCAIALPIAWQGLGGSRYPRAR